MYDGSKSYIGAYIFVFLVVVVGIIFTILYFTKSRPFCVERGIECEEDIDCCDSKYFECKSESPESGNKLCLYNGIIDNEQVIVLVFEGDYNEYSDSYISSYLIENNIKTSDG